MASALLAPSKQLDQARRQVRRVEAQSTDEMLVVASNRDLLGYPQQSLSCRVISFDIWMVGLFAVQVLPVTRCATALLIPFPGVKASRYIRDACVEDAGGREQTAFVVSSWIVCCSVPSLLIVT